MAVAFRVLAVVVVEDANGVQRRVMIPNDTRCDLDLVDRLLRLLREAKPYGAKVRLEQVHPALSELLDLVGVRDRFQRAVLRGVQATTEQSTR